MNVLLITLDTLRADYPGCYGYAKNSSPALDTLQAIVQDPPRPVMDEKTKERLKSLGYIK